MADEDKEKAEKLAAAKKRFEQLKKEQQKKGKKGTTKKKDEKTAEIKDDKTAEIKAEDSPADPSPEIASAVVEDEKEDADEEAATDSTQKMSISVQSKQRSESFRQGSGPLSPGSEVQDLYRKQASRIEELEKENKILKDQQEVGSARLTKTEEELEGLREDSSDLAQLKNSAKEAERIKTELASTQRQLAQAQQSSKTTPRRVSGTTPDLAEQIASKTSTIESLELELSNLRNQSNILTASLAERDAGVKELDERAQAAEAATDSVKQELNALKLSMTFPSEDTQAANEDPEALTKRISILESDLRTANTDLEAAAKRATSLEQKIDSLMKLHRDAAGLSQAKDKELNDLRSQLRRRDRVSHVRDASEFELGEEETETGALQARIRALEAENFDLRRGVWRDKRAELQPGMEDESGTRSPEYEDVDLNGPYTPFGGRGSNASRQQHSTFQDVITSGISAFTGRTRGESGGVGRPRGSTGAHGRKQSLGLLSEDGDDFDAEAFQLAQDEEARKRVERVKEVKRGLEKWKGWKMDLVDLRSNGLGPGRECGPVFEV